MALVPCPECGKEISTQAVACPHCGAPQTRTVVEVTSKKNKPFNVWFWVLVAILVAGGLSNIIPLWLARANR